MLLCALCLQAQRQLFFNLTAEEVRIGETLPVFVHTMDLGKNYGDSVMHIMFSPVVVR